MPVDTMSTMDASRPPYVNSGSMARGDSYDPIQLCKRYPELAPLYHPVEREYDPEPVLNWMKANDYMLPVVAVLLYCIFLYVGPRVMASRKPLPLTTAFAYWNLFLSLFSFYGVTRTVPHLIYRILLEDFEDTVCKSAHVAYGGGTAGLAIQIFVLSKIPELLDTVFLILLKKPVIFLHWYHHITVLLYCWNSYVTESSAGLWFAAMNYSVHFVMYMYFYLQIAFPAKASKVVVSGTTKTGSAALTATSALAGVVAKSSAEMPDGLKATVLAVSGSTITLSANATTTGACRVTITCPPEKSPFMALLSRFAPFITFMQIMQMFCGTAIVLACIYYGQYGQKNYITGYLNRGGSKVKFSAGYKNPPPNPNPANCGNTLSNLVAGGLMYASYLALFVAFAYRRFVLKKDDFGKKEGADDEKKGK